MLARMALNIGPGDAVITSPFTFFATGGTIARLESTPVFIDIRPADFNLDPSGARRFLEGTDTRYQALIVRPEQVKAIIPVQLYGKMAKMEELTAISREYSIPTVKDVAEAIGAKQALPTAEKLPRALKETLDALAFFPLRI